MSSGDDGHSLTHLIWACGNVSVEKRLDGDKPDRSFSDGPGVTDTGTFETSRRGHQRVIVPECQVDRMVSKGRVPRGQRSPTSAVLNAHKNESTVPILGEGPLSRAALLRETQQQTNELRRCHELCCVQQAELSAVIEQRRELEDALMDARANARTEQGQYRALVAASAVEVSRLRTALDAKSRALQAMEDEFGELRRELKLANRAVELGREENKVLRQQQEGREMEVERLKLVNEELRAELDTCRRKCTDIEECYNGMKAEIEMRAIMFERGSAPDKSECSGASGTDDSSNDFGQSEAVVQALEWGFRATFLQQHEEVARHQVEMAAAEGSMELLRWHTSHAISLVNGQLRLLKHHGEQLVTTLADTAAQPERMSAFLKKETDYVDSIATLAEYVQSVTRQVKVIEAAVGNKLLEGTLQHRNVQQQLQSERSEHAEKLQAMQAAVQTAHDAHARIAEQLYDIRQRYTRLFHLTERHCRRLILVCSSAHPKNNDKRGPDASAVKDEELSRSGIVDSRDESSFIACVEAADWQLFQSPLNGSDAFSCEEILSPTQEARLNRLLRRSQEVSRRLARELRELRTTCDTEWKKEQQRLLSELGKERERHKASVKRLQASLKTVQESEANSRKQVEEMSRVAVSEQQDAVRRVESAEHEVQAVLRREAKIQSELEIAQRQVDEQKQLVHRYEEEISLLEARLAAQREEHFDATVFRGRCEDLLNVTALLESRAQREERGQHILYELVRCCCSAMFAMTLRLGTVTAERTALCRAFEFQDEERQSLRALLREMVKKWKESTATNSLKQLSVKLSVRSSLFAVSSAVIACVRMRRLAAYSHRRRHVSFALDRKSTYVTPSPEAVVGLVPPACLIRFMGTVSPVAAHAIGSDGLMGPSLSAVVQLPPISELIDAFSSEQTGAEHSTSSVGASVERQRAMRQLCSLAKLDTSAEENQVYLTALSSPRVCGRVPRHCRNVRLGSGRARTSPLRCTLVEEMRALVEKTIEDLDTLNSERTREQKTVCDLLEEKQKLVTVLQGCEQRLTDLTQQLFESKQLLANEYVSREAYRKLQLQLEEAHRAFQEERATRRSIEDDNAKYLQRDVEMTRAVEQMRGEVRSLTIELAERDAAIQNVYGKPLLSLRPLYGIEEIRGGNTHGTTHGLSAGSLYVPRSVKISESTTSTSPQHSSCYTSTVELPVSLPGSSFVNPGISPRSAGDGPFFATPPCTIHKGKNHSFVNRSEC
ncbi:hypothetical protein ERJ75_001462500 [Trypanosoma vivax]|nr:hypothetical protein ERJ75_001462500 [Trypanosoma vivax]